MSHQVGLAVFYVDTRLDHPQEKWIEIILVDGKLVDFMEFSPAKIVDFMGFTGIFPCEHIFLQGFYRDKQWNHCIYISPTTIWAYLSWRCWEAYLDPWKCFFGVIEYWRWIESKDWNPGFGISDCSWGNTPCLPIVAICKESHISNFWLVVWNIILFFHILGIIIPTDFHIFQRGFRNHQPANLFA